MANYYASARSNYFRVKNEAAFKDWCNKVNLDWWTRDNLPGHPGETFYAISPAHPGDCDGWPSTRLDDEECEEIDIDMETELPQHLDPRDVAVLMEVGAEKLRYLTGYAVAIHATKPAVYLSLSSITELARNQFGDDVTITDPLY